jgi:regulator of sigma E protease
VHRSFATSGFGLFSSQISIRELQGVAGIAHESGQAASHGPAEYIDLVAVISLNLGILNLLPIPILDGGHVLVLAIEGAFHGTSVSWRSVVSSKQG